jgi:hypothetical protein
MNQGDEELRQGKGAKAKETCVRIGGLARQAIDLTNMPANAM